MIMKNTIGSRNFIKAAGILFIAAVLVMSSTAVGTITQTTTMSKGNNSSRDDTILLEEGFEGGVMPPAGWTKIDYNYNKKWQIVNTTTYPQYVANGTYAAAVLRSITSPQDEKLVSPTVAIDPDAELVQLSFNVYSWTLQTGATLQVLAQTALRQDVLWDMIVDESWDTQMYRQVIINVSQYAGHSVIFTWRYVGQAGPNVAIDDIIVVQGDIPAPPIFDATMAMFQRKGVITVKLSNIQTLPGGNATDVQWSVHAYGNAILKKINETDTGVIPFLAMGSSADCSVDNVTGFCAITITITVNAPRAPPFEKTFKGLLLWRLAIIGKSA